MRPSTSLAHIQIILLMVALSLGPVILSGIRPWIFIPSFFILTIVAGMGLVRAFYSPQNRLWKPDLIDYSVILFTLYAILRSCFSPVEYDSRLEILKVIAYAIIFFTFRYGIERRAHALTILFGLVLLGVGVSLFGFFLKANPDFHPFGETFHLHYAPRLTGTFGCPNHIGYFLVMTSSIALSIGFFSHLPWVVRIIILYSSVPMIIALGLTLSRGSWIAMSFALLAITILAVRIGKVKRWIPISFFLFILLSAVGFIYTNKNLSQRLAEGFDTQTLMVNKEYCRIQLFLDALKISKDYPLFGTGPATFLYEHPRYQSATYPSLAVFTHNDYANTLADYGIVGLLLALLFVIAASIKLSRNPQLTEQWHDRVFLSIAAAVMSALIVHSFFDFNLHIPANALLFFALIGLGLRQTNPVLEKVKPRKALSIPLVLASLVLVYFIYELQRTARGYFPLWSLQRQEASLSFEKQIETLEKAAEQDPRSPVIARTLAETYRQEAARNLQKEIRYPLALKSIHWYEIAHKQNPLDDTIAVHLAMTYDLMERYMEAYQYYLLAVSNQPYSGYFWVEFASHYWRQGLLSKAMEAYQTALACPYHPENIRTEINLLQQEINKQLERIAQEKKKNLPEPPTLPSESSTPEPPL